ncbi:hypothetical protein ACWGI0_06065 [Streptomyces sp. NPDC054802]
MLKILGRLSDLAEGQTGMVTDHQAAGVGADSTVMGELVASRVIEQVLPVVCRLRGGARHPFPRLYANWLLLQPELPAWERLFPTSGVVSHGAALRLYGVGSLPGPAAEFTASGDAGPLAIDHDVTLHEAVLADDEVIERAGLPVTTPGRTLADVAEGAAADLEQLGRIATNFLRLGVASELELAQGLERALASRGETRSGTDCLAALLDGVDGAESRGCR